MSANASPIILTFSGGLDTSFCVPWLKETYDRPVVTATVDTGGLDNDAAEALAWSDAETQTKERVQNLRDRGIRVRTPDVAFLIEL